MNDIKDKDMIKNLEDDEVEKVSGGSKNGKTYEGPTPEFGHPIAMDYGMPSPRMKYGMPRPKIERPVAMDYGMPMPRVEYPVVAAEYGMPTPKKIDTKLFEQKSSETDN